LPLPTHQFHRLKTCTELPTPRDKLSLEPVTSLLRNKFKTTFGSPIFNLEEDDEQTCLDDIGGGGREELNAIATLGNIEEKLKPNLDKVINNIQIELVVFINMQYPL
jgi:hypothetical protein